MVMVHELVLAVSAVGVVGVVCVALTWKEMENDDDREFTRFGRGRNSKNYGT